MSGLFDNYSEDAPYECRSCSQFTFPFGNSSKGYCKLLATITHPDFGCVAHDPAPRSSK